MLSEEIRRYITHYKNSVERLQILGLKLNCMDLLYKRIYTSHLFIVDSLPVLSSIILFLFFAIKVTLPNQKHDRNTWYIG